MLLACTNFNVLNMNRCKFEFSNDPRQFYNFVNAKLKSSALPSSVRLNSIEAYTDLADLFVYLCNLFTYILILAT